ncbi:signal peptidase I [Leifsonia sp. EB34]|uniref:signal peptidase I n=1 Tax=Leifsonia sp. EB34 TaxID=3156303 RepID=UPI0035126D0F
MAPRRPDSPRRSLWQWLGSALLTVSAILGAVAIVTVAVCAVFGLRPVVVISGSMEPTLPVGSLVFYRTVPAADVVKGDIVTVPRQDGGTGLITHRVKEVTTKGDVTTLRLKGDANATPDPLPYVVSSVGSFVGVIPVAGTIALAARTPLGIAAVATYVAALVAVIVFGRRRPAARKRRQAGHLPAE